MQNVVKESCGHLIADFLTGSNETQSKNSSLAVFLITQAFMDHFLNLENITTSNVGSTDDHDFDEFLDGMLNHANSLKSGLAFVLLTHEKQGQTNTEILGKVGVELYFVSFHQSLNDSAGYFLVALTDVCET